MLPALRVIGGALYEVGSHFTLSLAANVIGIALSLPILVALSALTFVIGSLGIVPLGITLLVAVLPNPALAGVHAIAREMARRERPVLADGWNGLRSSWRLVLRAWLFALPITGVIVLNVIFYGQIAVRDTSLRAVGGPLQLIWVLLLCLWVAMHLYVFPLLLAQERPSVLLAYRNAAVVLLRRPLFTAFLTPLWIALLLVSSATGLSAVISLTLGATIQQGALFCVLPALKPMKDDDSTTRTRYG